MAVTAFMSALTMMAIMMRAEIMITMMLTMMIANRVFFIRKRPGQ